MVKISGKILRVNLSSKQVFTEDAERYEEGFIGGSGINSWILFNEAKRAASFTGLSNRF